MKILFVQDSLGTGGAERSNADLWYFLVQREVAVRVIVLRSRTEGVQAEVEQAGIDVTVLPTGSIRDQVKAIAQIIGDWKPGLVHSVLLKSALRVRLAKLMALSFRHLESLVNTTYTKERLADPALNWFKLNGYRAIDAVTSQLFTDRFHAITEVVAEHHRKKLGISADRIRVIPRGRESNPYLKEKGKWRSYYEKEWELQANDLLLVSTGRQEFQKGHTHFLSVLGQLKERGNSRFKYVILGRRGHASESLDRQISELGLEDHVIRPGHRSDVERILAAADLFVFPSVYEGLGVSLIEAQAAGLPVLCSDIPVFREVTLPGKNAVLLPLSDREAWVSTLNTLVNQPEKRAQMGTFSLQNFRDRFQLEEVHQRMLAYYRDIISKSI